MARIPYMEPCECCGKLTDMLDLDCKPRHLAGKPHWLIRLMPWIRLSQLRDAADRGFDFDVLECEGCYGPGYNKFQGDRG